MAEAGTLHDAFIDELRDTYGAERQLTKALAKLGITGYGFAPLKLPAHLDFPAMFHGVDERVPLDALVFGRRVLGDLLLNY